MRFGVRGWVAGAVAAAAMLAAGAATAEPTRLTVATGSELGTYHPVGVALKLLLQQDKNQPVALTVAATQGSLANVEGLRGKDYDLAIVQADVELDAYRGAGGFQGRPFPELRSILALHEEQLALVVRSGLRINGVGDLSGRKVDVGPAGAGGRYVIDRLVTALGKTGPRTVELATGEAGDALCDKRIDAAFLFIGHPSAVLVDALGRCRAKLVPVAGATVERLIGELPAVHAAEVPGRAYAAVPKAVPTLGVRAILVGRADLPDDVVTALLHTVDANRDLLRRLHPALTTLRDAALKPESFGVPLHPAAERFFSQTVAKN